MGDQSASNEADEPVPDGVLLLPYLDQQVLYDQYRFDEPWDGPHNRLLATKVSSPHFGGAQVLSCDGAVRFFSEKIPSESLRAWLTAHAGDRCDDF